MARRPGRDYSYTSNFPYDPLAGNTPPAAAYLWSALSLITLLAGTATILFAFGKFDYLGWKGLRRARPSADAPGGGHRLPTGDHQVLCHRHPACFWPRSWWGRPRPTTGPSRGVFTACHLYQWFPSNILRTWHLQLAIFWIATAYVAGGLVLAASLGEKEPRGQVRSIHVLFWALVVVVAGSLLGEILGINQLLGNLWFWFGHQGWEYLDLGRAWQILLAVGLVVLGSCSCSGPWPCLQETLSAGKSSALFMLAALAIPVFYLPAFFFGSTTNYTVVDNWRFWIIHLWVEGFFELLVTAMVAVTFLLLGVVSRQTAARVVYLDAILFLGSGIVGTGHHWYWTGQSHLTMALAALFSAMEVVPLTLLTLDAWDFIKLTQRRVRGLRDQPCPINGPFTS